MQKRKAKPSLRSDSCELHMPKLEALPGDNFDILLKVKAIHD